MAEGGFSDSYFVSLSSQPTHIATNLLTTPAVYVKAGDNFAVELQNIQPEPSFSVFGMSHMGSVYKKIGASIHLRWLCC